MAGPFEYGALPVPESGGLTLGLGRTAHILEEMRETREGRRRGCGALPGPRAETPSARGPPRGFIAPGTPRAPAGTIYLIPLSSCLSPSCFLFSCTQSLADVTFFFSLLNK